MGIRAVANYTGKRSCHRMPGGGFDSAAELITSFNGPKVWYDLSNVATLQQDSAGTIPVVAAGDPIGRVMDISGANNHATQAVALSCPLWQTTYAAFDGVDDSWATPAIDFTSTDKVTVIVGVRKLSDAAIGVPVELSALSGIGNPGSFAMFTPSAPTVATNLFRSVGSAQAQVTSGAVAAPSSLVITGIGNIAGDFCGIRTNGGTTVSVATDQGTGSFGNYPLYLGRRGGTTLPLNGNIYGLIVIGRLLSVAETRMLENYMAAKVGIVI